MGKDEELLIEMPGMGYYCVQMLKGNLEGQVYHFNSVNKSIRPICCSVYINPGMEWALFYLPSKREIVNCDSPLDLGEVQNEWGATLYYHCCYIFNVSVWVLIITHQRERYGVENKLTSCGNITYHILFFSIYSYRKQQYKDSFNQMHYILI